MSSFTSVFVVYRQDNEICLVDIELVYDPILSRYTRTQKGKGSLSSPQHIWNLLVLLNSDRFKVGFISSLYAHVNIYKAFNKAVFVRCCQLNSTHKFLLSKK